MIDPNKLKARLEETYEHVREFTIGAEKNPAWLACNIGDRTFMLVSIYMDSEIGGEYKLEEGFEVTHVYNNFDVVQAEELRNAMIEHILAGHVEVRGDVSSRNLH